MNSLLHSLELIKVYWPGSFSVKEKTSAKQNIFVKLTDLSDDIFIKIFTEFFTANEFLKFGLVNKKWQKLANNDVIWRVFYSAQFTNEIPEGIDAKTLYKEDLKNVRLLQIARFPLFTNGIDRINQVEAIIENKIVSCNLRIQEASSSVDMALSHANETIRFKLSVQKRVRQWITPGVLDFDTNINIPGIVLNQDCDVRYKIEADEKEDSNPIYSVFEAILNRNLKTFTVKNKSSLWNIFLGDWDVKNKIEAEEKEESNPIFRI